MINIIAAILYIIIAINSYDDHHAIACILSFISGANLVLGIVQLKRTNDPK